MVKLKRVFWIIIEAAQEAHIMRNKFRYRRMA
jgi:hypothetical protein